MHEKPLQSCHNLRQDEKKEPAISNKQFLVAEKRSRGQLAVGLWCAGFRAYDHGKFRGQVDRREELVERGSGGTESG